MALAAQQRQMRPSSSSSCGGRARSSRPAPLAAAGRRRRSALVVRAGSYAPPSTATAANELQALASMSNLVPDMVGLSSSVQPKAATISSLLLSFILNNEQLGMKPFANAIEASLNYDRCLEASGDARLSCQLDKALANVGSLMASQVDGRICTEIDPRLANDSAAMVAKAKSLLGLYEEIGVPSDKLIFRVPATWAGIQAAGQLEKEGVAMQVFHVYSFVQGAAAAQAGVSVVQPNVGRTRDWYKKNPGVIRDPHGPREDSGFSSGVDPGQRLASQIYTFCKAHYPKTQVMASGLRTKDDALALAGCDYLVVNTKVMAELEASPTLQGYNSGLSAAGGSQEDGVERMLSVQAAQAADIDNKGPIGEADFAEQLGPCGSELLAAALDGLVRDVETVLPFFRSRATGME